MKLIKFSFFIFSIIANSIYVNAQTDISIGKKYTITSETLNQDREIQIYLPDGYEESDKEYPVLYILDGQWHFTNGVAIQKSLRTPDLLPEMIVVGIQNQNPLRRTLFWDDRDKFLSFLEDEVINFVDSSFRTSDDRILFGWEAGAFFTNYAILNEKQLFNAAIITNGAYASKEMIDAFSNLNITNKKYLFISNSTKDIYYVGSSDSFVESLKEKSPNNLIWKYQQFNDEIHESLAYLALYHGLRFYYHNYGSLVFGSIQEYNELGGIPYLEEYFKKRGERYNFASEIDHSTKNSLIWLAWNRNDFEYFKFFMTEFEDVLSTKRYASAYWQNRFAQFYLKHNDIDNAIKYFNKGISTYPQDTFLAEMHSGLGKSYFMKKEKKKAVQNCKKAIEIAERSSDPKLGTYKNQLSELKNKH